MLRLKFSCFNIVTFLFVFNQGQVWVEELEYNLLLSFKDRFELACSGVIFFFVMGDCADVQDLFMFLEVVN